MKVVFSEPQVLDLSIVNFINGMVAKEVTQKEETLKFKNSNDFVKAMPISEVKTAQIGFITCNLHVGFYRTLFVESIEGSGSECLKFMAGMLTNFKALEGEHWEIKEFCSEI